MDSIFNKRVLNLIPLIFLIIIILKVTYLYIHLSKNESSFAFKEAEVLNSYSITHRNYYQKLFIDKTILLNEKTIKALPAWSNSIISKEFSQNNSLNITVRTVSDRARNPKNNADKDELKAITFFNKNSNAKVYFSDNNNNYYQYASVLRIDNKCLQCHGKREKAPKYIREKYDKAYNYKIGDVRGVLSIKIPTVTVQSYFFRSFIESTIYDILLLIALYFGISYLTRKSKSVNKILEREIKEKTTALKNTYVIDKLTDQPNRRRLIDDLFLHKNSAHKYLALINIDDFKDINDFYGHSAGDKILKNLATVFLKECKCEKSQIYKLPSDEFAIFSTKEISRDEFIQNISELLNLIHKTEFNIQDNKIFIILSCGISCNQNELMITADMALKKAKQENKSIIIYDYKLNMSKKIIENRQNVTLLREAIEKDNIMPFFQAIYNVETNEVEKYECLVRIVLDDGTIIPPYKFLNVAVKSKQYFHITKIMITKSFDYFRERKYEFSINLSILDITNKDIKEFIVKTIQAFPEPHRVVFEILENDKLGNYKEVKNFIKEIKNLGCKFAIDDFGSGYSNFSHIYELNVDYLKIDASLIKNIATDKNSRLITKTIIDFASNLQLKTVAEYVEDEVSFNLLKEMGIDYIQGYYIAKPKKNIS